MITRPTLHLGVLGEKARLRLGVFVSVGGDGGELSSEHNTGTEGTLGVFHVDGVVVELGLSEGERDSGFAMASITLLNNGVSD